MHPAKAAQLLALDGPRFLFEVADPVGAQSNLGGSSANLAYLQAKIV